MNEQPTKRLTRSSTDSMLGGVCGGLAEYAGFDPTLVRVAAVIALCIGFPGVIVGYVVAWAIMPKSVVGAPVTATTTG